MLRKARNGTLGVLPALRVKTTGAGTVAPHVCFVRRREYERKESQVTGKQCSTADQTRGLACHRCGGHEFRVIYTRPTWGERIMRRRECRHCGKRVTTWERPNW